MAPDPRVVAPATDATTRITATEGTIVRKQLQGHRRLLGNLAALAFLGGWFVTFAPTSFHGPAAYVEVLGHSMDGTYRTGDLIITRTQDTYAAGDIVAYRVDGGQVIHRIIGGDGSTGYTLQGDNNDSPDPWHPTDEDVVGKTWLRFEGKAWLMHLPREPWFAGLSAGLITLIVLGWDARPRRRVEADVDADVAETDAGTDSLSTTDLALVEHVTSRST